MKIKWWSRLPLRYKLLLLLVTITTVSLTIYARLALTIFTEDKTAYVFDSSLAHVDAVAKLLRAEIDFCASKIQFFMKGYDTSTGQFHPYTKSIQPHDTLIKGLWSYQFDTQNNKYLIRTQSTDPNLSTQFATELNQFSPDLITLALENEMGLLPSIQQQGYWYLSIRYKQPPPQPPLVVIGLMNRGLFLDFFSTSQLQDTYLINQSSRVLIKSQKPTYTQLSANVLEEALEFLGQPDNGKTSVHTWTPKKSAQKAEPWLLSHLQVGVGQLKVVAFVPRSAALETIKLLAIKSTLFLILLISLAAFVSVFSANQLTATVKKLFDATRKVAKGEFDLSLPVSSEDEIGGLTQSFNQMTQEIKRLLLETAEKSRMEAELQTAKTVQSTLFPYSSFQTPAIAIEGFYEPASECGGDWWYYNQVGSKTFLWIGDATGHGVPAALVTSAARSAARILEELPDLPLEHAMSLLNKAINGTSGGNVNMTFFLACFDEQTQKLQYCNASHDPPFYLPLLDRPFKKSDIIPLMDCSGPRLGENPESTYTANEIVFNPGDSLILYTDGVTELKNNEGQLWGERKFITSLISSLNQGADAKQIIANINQEMNHHRKNTSLADDITYFMFQYLRML